MIEFTEEFNGYLRKYENVEIPDLNAFNKELLVWQEKLETIYSYPDEEKRRFAEYMITHLQNFHEILQIAILSILSYLFDGGEYAEKMIKLTRFSPFLQEDNKYFIYLQINSYSFRYKNFLNEEAAWQTRMLYRDIYTGYREKMNIQKNIVPKEDRNQDKVIFFIGQFLNEAHGPTKTVLDRCEIMAEKMGCQAIIINTNELRGIAGYIPYCLPFFGNTMKNYEEYSSIGYQGKYYPYVQCSEDMPNIPEMESVLKMVQQVNPYCMFMIGDGSICADLCSNYYPLIDVSTVPSGILTTEGQFLLKGKPVTDKDREYIKRLGKNEDYLQYCLFTWSVMPQTTQMTRQQVQIPQGAFAALVVGARLDYEVDDCFIQEVLLPLMKQGVFVVFMGVFDKYAMAEEKYPLLKSQSVFVGFIKDVLAVNELCNIYINPKRNGGGTSVIEAMVKGLPPVSLNEGDVSLGAGEDFCLRDYSEMVQRALRLKDDEEYYRAMSQKARERAAVMLDGASAFWETFQRIEKLPDFQ